jgi:hypothetical protein
MTANATPFVVDTNGGFNTKIDYLFASEGHKVKGSVVVEGTFTEEDIASLRENLEDGVSFNPQKLGIPDLFTKMPASWNGDEVLHTIERISQITRDFDEDAPSAQQIVALVDVSSIPTNWNTESTGPRI